MRKNFTRKLWGACSALALCASSTAFGQAPADNELTRLPPTASSEQVVPVVYENTTNVNYRDAAPDRSNTDELVRRLQAAESEIQALKQQQNGVQLAQYGSDARSFGRTPGGTDVLPPSAPIGDVTLGNRVSALEKQLKGGQKPSFPTVQLHGFFQYDTAYYSQDATNQAAIGNVQNGSGFRRTRLMAQGNVTEQTSYWVEMDFAQSGRPSFQDVWGQQSDIPLFGNIRGGQYRQPVTMDSWTNIKHLEFFERSSAFQAFDPFRRVGGMAWFNSTDQRSLLAYSVFGTAATFWNGTSTTYTDGIDNRNATSIGDSGGVSFAIRGSHLLYYDDPSDGRYLLHVGGGYVFQEIGGSGNTGTGARTYRAFSNPGTFVGDASGGGVVAAGTPSIVDTGRFLATNDSIYHLEFAGNYGQAHFQSEIMATAVQQLAGPMVYYEGGYFQTGYFLTGESCGYNKQMGVMDYNVKPYSNFFGLGRNSYVCGWGAWETAFRYDYLNLSSTNILAGNILPSAAGTIPAQPNPGILNNYTAALNWWWNPYTRVQFNYIYSDLNNNLAGRGAMQTYATRFQIEF